MARRGVFGRLPRAAPDLTNTIVALVREANAMEDNNFVDAWKNGGKVEGKGVDDERLLEHMKMRRDQLSPEDPAWDQWNNRVAQYDFSINESKMSLKYDQKKISEQTMSNFYAKWAGRSDIQQDSEFYRHLLSQQAKWHAAAAQGSASRGRSNAYAAHNNWVEGVLKDKVQPAADASSYILEIAKIYQAVPDNPSATLTDVYENTKGWGSVMDIIDDGKSDNPIIQTKIDQATALIQKTKGKDWKWNKASIAALFDDAADGSKSLIKNSMNDTERKKWRKVKGDLGYDATRVKGTEASLRVAQAADNWAEDLDDCKGDSYCARRVTKDYRDALVKNGASLIAQPLGMGDTEQQGMLATTISQLDDVIAGRKVNVGRSPAADLGGGQTKDVEQLTQIDIFSGTSKPGGFIGLMGNLWNDDIKKLDAGGWVSSEPLLGGDGSQQVDGEGNPQYHFVTHAKDEVPMPGLVPVTGTLTFEDPTRGDIHAAGGPQVHTVRPVQYVMTEPAAIVTVDSAGTVINPGPDSPVVGQRLVNGKPDPASPPQTKPSAGYDILKGVVGPDGTARTLYRTGDGVKVPFLYHTEPPVPTGTKLTLDPKTGAKVPTYVAQPVTDSTGKVTAMVYDTGKIADAIKNHRTQMDSGNFVLGTYETQGATAAAQSVNAVFAKAGNGQPTPAMVTEANKYLNQFKASVAALPNNDPSKFQANRDLNQLTQTVNLHAGNKMGASIDDQYGAMNDRTPQQQRYEQQLNAAGFRVGTNGVDRDEMSRRVGLLEEIDKADARVAAQARLYAQLHPMGLGGTDPAEALRGRMNQADIDALTKAKQDVTNPLISVSNIKIPGAPQLLQGMSPEEQARQAGIQAGLSLVGGAAPKFPVGTPFAAPASKIVVNGPPVSTGTIGHPGKEADDRFRVTTPTLSPAPVMTGVDAHPGKAKDDIIAPTPSLKTTPGMTGVDTHPGKLKDDLIVQTPSVNYGRGR